jgi:hypothetical protein
MELDLGCESIVTGLLCSGMCDCVSGGEYVVYGTEVSESVPFVTSCCSLLQLNFRKWQ